MIAQVCFISLSAPRPRGRPRKATVTEIVSHPRKVTDTDALKDRSMMTDQGAAHVLVGLSTRAAEQPRRTARIIKKKVIPNG